MVSNGTATLTVPRRTTGPMAFASVDEQEIDRVSNDCSGLRNLLQYVTKAL